MTLVFHRQKEKEKMKENGKEKLDENEPKLVSEPIDQACFKLPHISEDISFTISSSEE